MKRYEKGLSIENFCNQRGLRFNDTDVVEIQYAESYSPHIIEEFCQVANLCDVIAASAATELVSESGGRPQMRFILEQA